MKHAKYTPFSNFLFNERTWPNKTITKAPIWASVDLRDGNQALEIPMTLSQKIEFFKFLVKIGFKEIEIGFPAASDTEFLFARTLIEENLIPDDVTIQVLTQAREHIIERTFEALEGVKHAIVHFYNSTSTLQRDVVFNMSKEEIKNIAIEGAKLVKSLAEKYGKERFIFQYSPESFTGTELDYAIDVCEAVSSILDPTPAKKLILNLPATVEMSTPNIYADQIEYMCKNLKNRECITVCVHCHNDRGTGVAATELAILAGADRVEGTLFGNGERTGNADILNVALNLYSQGIDPELDFSDIDEVVRTYESVTNMSVHQRHPYAGELVFTAFSGSHQDAIKKGMAKMSKNSKTWAVPYLPIDPVDLGRNYDPIIRINSQSGKGGVAFILEKSFGLHIPRSMQQHFGGIATKNSDKNSSELTPDDILKLFNETYVNIKSPISLLGFKEYTNGEISITAKVSINGIEKEISGCGNGLLSAFASAIKKEININFDIESYSEHSLEQGTESRAITYVHISGGNGANHFGAGISGSISKSSIKALISAINCIKF